MNELRLNIYAHGSSELETSNMASIIELISKCPNLKMLHLHVFMDHWRRDGKLRLLNETEFLAPIFSIVENLEILVLKSNRRAVALDGNQVIRFKNLKPLSVNCIDIKFDNGEAWNRLLEITKNTLENLHMFNVSTGYEMTSILPFPMEKLRSFHLDMVEIPICIDHLVHCPALNDVTLELDWEKEPQLSSLNWLNRLRADVGISLYIAFSHTEGPYDYFDSPYIRTIDLIGPKITVLCISVYCGWIEPMADLLHHSITNCPNLTKLSIHNDADFYDDILLGREEDVGMTDHYYWQRSMTVLQNFFNNPRAAQLIELDLHGCIDTSVLDSLFMHCTNLQKLRIQNGPLLTNWHLISWAMDGQKVSELIIIDCEQVIDDGLIPLLINSMECLTKFAFKPEEDPPWTGHRLWNILAHCSHLNAIAHFGGDEQTNFQRSSHWHLEFVV